MDPLTDPRCLVTPEAVLIDGANGVCRAPRLGLAPWEGLLVAALVVLVVALGARRKVRLAAGVCVMAAVPGLFALAAVRADRPAQRAQSAAPAMQLHDAVRAFSQTDARCAVVSEDACLVCAPIARLALAAKEHCADPRAVRFGADALGQTCHVTGDAVLECGAVE